MVVLAVRHGPNDSHRQRRLSLDLPPRTAVGSRTDAPVAGESAT